MDQNKFSINIDQCFLPAHEVEKILSDLKPYNASPSVICQEYNNARSFANSCATFQEKREQRLLNVRQTTQLLPVLFSEESIPSTSGFLKDTPNDVECEPYQGTACAAVPTSRQSSSFLQGLHLYDQRKMKVTNPEELWKETNKNVENKRYECENCQKRFIWRSHLTRHLLVHSNEEQHQCEICELRFKRKCDLTDHKRKIHQVGKTFNKYKCNICQKTFNYSCRLKQHMFAHSNARPYRCGICGYRAKCSYDLNKHNRRKHTEKNADFEKGSGSILS